MSGVKRSGASGGRKVHHAGGDLIALGSKATSKTSLRHPGSESDDLSKPSKSSSTLVAGGNPAKKFKPAASGENTGGLFSDPIRVSQVGPQSGSSGKQTTSTRGHGPSPQPGTGSSQQPIIEVRPAELVSAIKNAKSAENGAKMLGGALRQLKLSRAKPDMTLNSALVTLVREYPDMFSSVAVIEGLVQILKREPSIMFKVKSNPSVYVLAAQLLLVALKDSYDWPEIVAKVYVEDALGDRIWVDLGSCKEFVANICTLFNTKAFVAGQTGSASSGSGVTGSGSVAGKGGEVVRSVSGETGEDGEGSTDVSNLVSLSGIETAPRFSPSVRKALKTNILQVVNEQFGRHSIPADNVSRNLLKFLTTSVGFPELRLVVAQKIDSWIQNPKLGKLCQELLMTVAVNCHAHSPEDIKVIETLINIRLKTKLFSSQFVACIKELIGSHPANFGTVMRGVVNNELVHWRSPSNMALISMMIHSWPEEAAKLLGCIFQEFLTRKDDYLRSLRGFLREVVRVIRNEFNFTTFVRSLMQDRTEPEFSQLEPPHKERMVHGLADLICCASMLTANMLIREAYNGYNKGEKAMVSQLQDFFSTLGLIQRDAVWWIHTVVASMFRPQPVEYKACLRKVLFLEGTEAYTSKDNWPPEADRSLIHKMMGEACLKEDTLMRVLVIGLTRELPLSPADAMDIADVLVARAANAHTDDILRLPSIERKELFNAIFDITVYRPPANIQLPEGYHPPSLAISKLYWKGWLLLLVLSTFNPKTIGAIGWSEYPMLRGMMEMVMTNSYSFPMSMNLEVSEDGMAESKESASMKEMQLARSEKEAILEYENHLASSSGQKVTESSSYLLNQVTMLNPKGPARKLPSSVTELIKTVSRTLKLGQLLCRCRSPDFLLKIIKKQGTLESMKWLTDLVESSHSSMEVLPVPCLCEFLMASYQDQLVGAPGSTTDEMDPNSHRSHYKRKRTAKDKAFERHKQLIEQLQNLMSGPKSSPQSCTEVLAYFLEKLTLSHLTPRKLAINALHDILAKSGSGTKRNSSNEDTEDEEYHSIPIDGERLISCLPGITHFVAILPQIYRFLLQACLVETNLNCLQHYLLFLTQNYPHDKLYESVIGISRLIVDRFDVIRKILSPLSCGSVQGSSSTVLLGSLLELFRSAMEAAIHSQSMPQLSSTVDFLLVSFPTVSQKAIFHTAFVQAIFLLLSQNPPPGAGTSDFMYLLDLWAPLQPLSKPEACTIESKEKVSFPPSEVLLSTMLSTNPRILEASIQVAKPSELCKFVQEFGCPVGCIDKILEVLDNLCKEHSAAAELRHCVTNPVSMARSVEIQMLRGLNNGKTFLTLIKNFGNIVSDDLEDQTTPMRVASEKDYGVGTRSSLLDSSRHKLSRLKSQVPLPTVKASTRKKKVRKDIKHEAISALLTRTCKDINNSVNPFENESALVRTGRDIVQSSSPRHFEAFIGTLVKKSVMLNMEERCIQLLQKIKKAVVGSYSPIALQCNPKLFNWKVPVDSEASLSSSPDLEVPSSLSMSPDITGLLVDIFELLDPEIVDLCPDISMRFIFGHAESFKDQLSKDPLTDNMLLSGQGYLLTQLVNNSSWYNLLAAVSRVLDETNVQGWMNPSAVLDFLWACLHKPCLWRERVKKEAIVNSSISLGVDEDSELHLTCTQLETLVNYILKESVSYIEATDEKSESVTSSDDPLVISAEVKSLLRSRLPLLMCCCSDDKSLCSVVEYLQTNTSFPSLSWQLLVHLYHANEKVIFRVDQPHPLTMSALDTLSSSKMDSQLHYLISAMADAQPGQASHQKICNAALLCRKITLHHPALMLRQLPMLGWMLKGRAHLRPGEFRNRNHKLVFENVFTLLEMLLPLVFEDSQADSLNLCLEAFFDFMKNHCSESKKYQDIVSRFSDFLVQYIYHNRDKAAEILHKNLDILRSLSDVHNNKKSSLKPLIECFPKIPDNSNLLSFIMVPPTLASQGLTHEQVMPFLKKLENGQEREDVLKVLQDLKETSLHSVDILKHFVPELCRIIQDPEPESCKLAHDLLLRHLKHSPSSVDELLPAFISCLESQEYSIIKAVVPSLPDLLLVCKGSDAKYLLTKLFLLTTHSSYDCTSELIKCIEAFTQHTIKS